MNASHRAGLRLSVWSAMVAALLLCAERRPAFAQAETEANIIGVVTDESGAVLPGVTVVATSPALQVGKVTTVTDATGEYRLSGVTLGTYEVTYTLDGFQTLRREGLRLTAGFTAKVDIQLKLGALSETLTVSGSSPVVDVTSTKPATSLTRETLELIPTSRNGVQAMLAQAPGVRSNLDVGGNTAGAIPQFRAFGQVAGSWPVIEGVAISAPASSVSQPGIYLDYGGIEEAQVTAVGNDAETPTRGILLNMVVKSGGNNYHGTFMSSYTHRDLVSNNIDAQMAAQNIRGVPILDRWDAGGDVSGYILKDRLWFYGGIRGRVNNNGVLDCVRPEGGQCITELSQQFDTVKATYQAGSANRIIGYYQRNYKTNDTGASNLVAWESRFHQDFIGNMGKVEWQGTPRNNLVANALVGYWDFDSLQTGYGNAPSTLDIATLARTGTSSQSYHTPNNYFYGKYQVKGSLGWYSPDSFMGDHNVKGGFDFIKGWDIIDAFHHENGDYILQFSNGTPFQLQAFNYPLSVRNDDAYTSFFVKDQWRVASRLTLNLGVRLSIDQAYVPEQSRVAGGSFPTLYPAASFERVDLARWTNVVPRVHAAYDLTGDGKTVVKGGWGRFAAIRGVDEANYVNPIVMSSTTFRWRDLNNNRLWDAGESDLNPNGPDFVSNTGFTRGILNRNEKAPITDEFSLSVERQLWPDFAIRVSGIYSKDTNVVQQINPLIPYEAYNIPITSRDPGPDGITGNFDDPGTSITYWEFPTSLRGADFQAATRVNDPRLDRSFKSAEIAFSKRLSRKWQALAAYSITKLNVPAQFANPNQQIFGDDNTTEWTVKASGAYMLPRGVLASINYELRNGARWQRTHLFRGGVTIPTIVVPVEPLGAQRYDNLHLVDGRVRKDFQFRAHKFAVGADIFNLLNLNTVTSVNTRSGATYGRITTAAGNTATLPFLPGRNVQLTLNYSF